MGWRGANQFSAPLTPIAMTTSLLQIGQPTAKSDSMLPANVLPPCVAGMSTVGSRTYVATKAPVSADDSAQTG